MFIRIYTQNYNTNLQFVVKSPAYCKRSAAELKVKESILTCYTKKAQSVLKEMRYMRHQKAHSWSTNRNSSSTNRNSMSKDFCNDISSPFRTINNWGLSTPSEFAPFKTHHIRPSTYSLKVRRTRECRNNVKEGKRITFKELCDHKTETTAKSIQSITIYKGPIAKAYSISTTGVYTSPKNNMEEYENYSKNSSLLIDSKNREPKRNSTLQAKIEASPISNSKPMRHSTLAKDYERSTSNFIDGSTVELFKASSLLPGTSNLRISQDIPKNYLRGSYHTLESPFSSSTRSSLKRAKLIENPIANYSTTIHSKQNYIVKTRNIEGSKSSNQSIKSMTCKKPIQKQIKKLVVHRRTGQQDKVVLMAQVNLDKNSKEISAINSRIGSKNFSNMRKSNDASNFQIKIPESSCNYDNKSMIKSSVSKSKMLSIRTNIDGKPKLLSKKSSSPLFPSSDKNFKK